MYKHITRYTFADKVMFLNSVEKEGVVDELMIPLVDEINEIPELITMNCCIGGSLPYTEKEVRERGKNGTHCPNTYVSFYVINHHYEVAHALMAYIQNKFVPDDEADDVDDVSAWCSMEYEKDGYIEDDCFILNGKTSLRFCIQGDSPDVIKEITQVVKEFKEYVLFDE